MYVLYRIGFWFYLSFWSRLYRFLKEVFGSRRSVLKPYSKLDDLVHVLENTKWVKDGLRESFDAVDDPRRFQYLLERQSIPKSGRDCDEFATYAYSVLRLYPIEGVTLVGVLTVNWWRGWSWKLKVWGGHHVCLIKLGDEYAHIGNWGLFRGFASVREAIESVLRTHKMLGWILWDYPATPIRYDTKLP